MKKQVVFIHGGETFNTYSDYIQFLKNCDFNLDGNKQKRWKQSLEEKLGDDFMIITPRMPCKYNAKYKEWKIWFEKIFIYLEDNVVLIGHSLGGIFLAKYLSENNFPKKILATYLIAAPYNDVDFILPKDLQKFEKQTGIIFIYHSEDDPIVPFTDLRKYAVSLPKAKTIIFKNKGHFLQEEFPELIKSIQQLY